MKISLLQIDSGDDKDANFRKTQKYIIEAAEQKADIICLSEIFLYQGDNEEKRVEKLSSHYVVAFQELAKTQKINLILGSILLIDESAHKPTNTCLIINRKGEFQANKAQLAYTAMQDYRNIISKIRSDNTQFVQNLYLKQVDSENALKLKRTQASQAAESFTYFTSPDLQGQVVGLGNKTGTAKTIDIPGGGRLQKIGTEKEDLIDQLGNLDLTNIGG